VLADIGFVLLVVPFESHRFLLLQILASAANVGQTIAFRRLSTLRGRRQTTKNDGLSHLTGHLLEILS
jgi:hypothetical protein